MLAVFSCHCGALPTFSVGQSRIRKKNAFSTKHIILKLFTKRISKRFHLLVRSLFFYRGSLGIKKKKNELRGGMPNPEDVGGQPDSGDSFLLLAFPRAHQKSVAFYPAPPFQCCPPEKPLICIARF